MNMLRLAFKEIVGMFVDDGALALQSLLLIAVVTIAVEFLAVVPGSWARAALVAGFAVILVGSVYRAARQR